MKFSVIQGRIQIKRFIPVKRFWEKGTIGCLPFTQKTRLIDRCSKWNVTNLKWNFLRGYARPISTTLFRKIGTKAIQAERPGTTKTWKTSKWDAHFLFGNSV